MRDGCHRVLGAERKLVGGVGLRRGRHDLISHADDSFQLLMCGRRGKVSSSIL